MINKLCKGCQNAVILNGKWKCKDNDQEICIGVKSINITTPKWIDEIDVAINEKFDVERNIIKGEKIISLVFNPLKISHYTNKGKFICGYCPGGAK